MHDPRVLRMSSWLVDYPFADRLYAGALEAVKHVQQWGPAVILSDGDAVFQPRKVARAGLWAAFDGGVAKSAWTRSLSRSVLSTSKRKTRSCIVVMGAALAAWDCAMGRPARSAHWLPPVPSFPVRGWSEAQHRQEPDPQCAIGRRQCPAGRKDLRCHASRRPADADRAA